MLFFPHPSPFPPLPSPHLFSLQVLAVFTGRGGSTAGFVDSADADAGTVGIVLSDTSFYYESGGQVFDTGALQLHTADGEFFFLFLFVSLSSIILLY